MNSEPSAARSPSIPLLLAPDTMIPRTAGVAGRWCSILAMDFDGTLLGHCTRRVCPAAVAELERIGNTAVRCVIPPRVEANVDREVACSTGGSRGDLAGSDDDGGVAPAGSVLRVVATGRNYASFIKTVAALCPGPGEGSAGTSAGASVLGSEGCGDGLPIDYAVIGSGAMTVRWHDKRIVDVSRMGRRLARTVAEFLRERFNPHFFILYAAPFNNCHVAFPPIQSDEKKAKGQQEGELLEDFATRIGRYQTTTQYCKDLDVLSDPKKTPFPPPLGTVNIDEAARPLVQQTLAQPNDADEGPFSQFVIMTRGRAEEEAVLAGLRELSSHTANKGGGGGVGDSNSCDIEFVRTTSPQDHRTMWIEVFPRGVSKADKLDLLSASHGIAADRRVAVGNDHNDDNMLQWAGAGAFVVADSPPELKAQFRPLSLSSDDGGVAEAIRQCYV